MKRDRMVSIIVVISLLVLVLIVSTLFYVYYVVENFSITSNVIYATGDSNQTIYPTIFDRSHRPTS